MARETHWTLALFPALLLGSASGADSPLVLAVLRHDRAAIKSLLAAHADVRAANAAGATALHFAVDDLATTQALLEAGADPNAADQDGVTPLSLAVGRADGAPVVAALLAHGAHPQRLGAALGEADARVVPSLLEHGANPNARAALQSAAALGATDTARLLLEHGASLDGRDRLGLTALMWAALMGHAETVTLLLNRGADPDLQETFNGTTALMQAAASDRPSEAIVSALLAHGADVKLLDDEGANALTWARRSGQTAIAALLIAHGSPPEPTVVFHPDGAKIAAPSTPAQAVARAIPLLESSRARFRGVAHCASCHHDAFPAMALDAAQKRGLAVDSGARERELRATLGSLGPERDRYREGIGFADIAEAAYLLVGLAASGAPPDGTTDAIVRYLLSNQSPDGSWPPTMQRVPSDGCALALTAMSLRALSLYARNDESAAGAAASVGRARAFLSRAAAVTNEELTFQVLGLRWAGAAPAELAPLLGRLLARQQGDGGFAQRDGLASDAYATSQAIVALRDPSAPPAAKAALQRALQFLLADQRLDGSWFVATRALRFQPFLESGFPQHRSQYSSALATSWAVMALSPEIP